MSRKTMFAILSLLSALNVIALAVNVSLPSRAAVGGMSYHSMSTSPSSRIDRQSFSVVVMRDANLTFDLPVRR
jgi:hypothetical protein